MSFCENASIVVYGVSTEGSIGVYLRDRTINLPVKDTKFDRMFITGANELKIPGSLVARVVELTNCLAVTFSNSNITGSE